MTFDGDQRGVQEPVCGAHRSSLLLNLETLPGCTCRDPPDVEHHRSVNGVSYHAMIADHDDAVIVTVGDIRGELVHGSHVGSRDLQ